MKLTIKSVSTICQRLFLGFIIAVMACSSSAAPLFAATPAPATPDAPKTSIPELLKRGIPYYIPGDNCFGGATQVVPAVGGTVQPNNEQQIGNIKIILGIVKAYKLDKKAGLIALMTAMQESHIMNLANTSVPVSLENPNKQGNPGHDHDSVGVFQQRVGSGWSTFGSGTSKEIVWQLMDVAYSAQAFLGTPPGAQLPADLKNPGALKKGLQNRVPDYLTKDPGAAAQTVQVSAYPGAYSKHQPAAQGYIDQYWEAAPEIPLPIPINGGAAPGGNSATSVSDSCAGSGTNAPPGSVGALLETIKKYAWPDYRDFGSPGAMELTPAYAAAIKAAQGRGEYVGGYDRPGVDCGGFVTRAMRDSGADPEYNNKNGPTGTQKAYLESSPKYRKVAPSEPLMPGDIAIKVGHTYFYVGKLDGFNGDSASASVQSSAGSGDGRAPMAGPNDTRSDYDWYRLKQADTIQT